MEGLKSKVRQLIIMFLVNNCNNQFRREEEGEEFNKGKKNSRVPLRSISVQNSKYMRFQALCLKVFAILLIHF